MGVEATPRLQDVKSAGYSSPPLGGVRNAGARMDRIEVEPQEHTWCRRQDEVRLMDLRYIHDYHRRPHTVTKHCDIGQW